MRQSVTMRLDPKVLKAAKRKASDDNRTLTNYIETLVRRDLGLTSIGLQVIAPADIADSVPVPMPGETAAQRKRREAVFSAVIEAGRRK